jgi:undecaprenyl-diphosphatase
MRRVNRACTRRPYDHKRATVARFFVSSDDRPTLLLHALILGLIEGRYDYTVFAWYRIIFGGVVLMTAYFGLVDWGAGH